MNPRKKFQAEIGARLREIREERGVTQATCGEWLNLDQTAIAKREAGVVALRYPERVVLAQRFGLTAEEAFPMCAEPATVAA